MSKKKKPLLIEPSHDDSIELPPVHFDNDSTVKFNKITYIITLSFGLTAFAFLLSISLYFTFLIYSVPYFNHWTLHSILLGLEKLNYDAVTWLYPLLSGILIGLADIGVVYFIKTKDSKHYRMLVIIPSVCILALFIIIFIFARVAYGNPADKSAGHIFAFIGMILLFAIPLAATDFLLIWKENDHGN